MGTVFWTGPTGKPWYALQKQSEKLACWTRATGVGYQERIALVALHADRGLLPICGPAWQLQQLVVSRTSSRFANMRGSKNKFYFAIAFINFA